MEQIPTPKKEKRFLKAIGRVAGVLVQELALGLGRKYIGKMINKIKIPKKREMLSFLLLLSCTFAFAQYPATGNKQRLGYQTSGDGLVFRGRSSDTTALKPSTINNAYHLFDTVNNVLFSYIKTKGGWKFNNSDTVIIYGVTMPFDSITFNTAKDGTVGVGEVEYNDTQGSLIQGLKGGNVTNVIGQQLHQRVNNQTGATLTKGTAVYLSGSQGNRITAAKALATSDPTSANTFGIVAENISTNSSGYIITEGLITGINTLTLVEDSAVYLSPTVAGGLTSTKPQAPNHGVYIGVCVKSNAGSGELFVKIKNGLELDELHDVLISNPTNNASLYYKSNEGIWRDTTATLLVSDTASMLTNYLRSGVAGNTYLPLTGGTLTGLLKNTSQRLTGNITISDFDATYNSVQTGPSTSETVNLALQQNLGGAQNISMGGNQGGGGSTTNPNIYFTDNRKAYASIGGIHTSSGTNNQSGHIIFTTTPSLNTVALTERMRISQDGSITMGGTLGVTGATTLSNLAGSGTRMVTASSTGLLSTQSIPTGTVTSVGGTGTVNGITLTGTVTSSGNLTLGGTLSNVSLTSQVTGTLPILNGGTGATSALAARTNLGATVRGANTFLLADLGAISFLRYNADNTVSQRAADGMRSDLGGTTIGQSMFTLTNPSAITFPRFNVDNTVSALNAADFRIAIGAGTGNGNGTVTSVTGTLPISSSGGTTPNITIANASTTASGVVTTSTQSMAGNKTFTGDLATSGAFSATGFSTLTGGVSVGTMAATSSLTHLIGVNSSNTVGEITLGSGLNLSGGTLNLGGFVLATLDFPNTSAQSSSDITVTYTGAQVGQPVMLGIPDGSALSNSSFSAWVQSAGNVRVRFNNYSGFALNPSSNQFTIFVLNL